MLEFVLHSIEIFRSLLPAAALSSAEFRAWNAHFRYFTALMKSEFTDASIDAVDGMIFEEQRQFLRIRAYKRLWKPKNHFAQHIPADIKKFGPSRTYWCMRFEAKNQDHKGAAAASNFKNVPGTVATAWVERSHHRLSKSKRKRKEDGLNDGLLTHQGMEISYGTWLLIKGAGPAPLKLAQVTDMSGSGEDVTLYVDTFNPDAVLHDDDIGGDFAFESDLADGAPMTFKLNTVTMTQLTMVRHGDKVHFVEQA